MMSLSRIFTVFVALLAAAAPALVVLSGAPARAAPPRSAISGAEDLWSACVTQYPGMSNPDDMKYVQNVAKIPPDSLAAVRARMEPSLSQKPYLAWNRCVMDRRAQQISDQSALPRSLPPTPDDVADYIQACAPEVMAWLVAQRKLSGSTDFNKDSSGQNIYIEGNEEQIRFETVQNVVDHADVYANYSSYDLVYMSRSYQEAISRGVWNTDTKLSVCMMKRRLSIIGTPMRAPLRARSYKADQSKAAATRPPIRKK